MRNDGAEFTPEQVEQQIDLLMHSQKPWPDPLSDAHLLSELSQVYTDNLIVETVWQRLAERVKSERPHSVAEDVMLQRRSSRDVLPERHERPHRMHVKTREKRPASKISRLLELGAALLVIIALIAGAAILMTNAHQQHTLGSRPKGSTVAAPQTATQTPGGTIVFSDPLNTNRHHWPIGSSGSQQDTFTDGAYHITNEGAQAAIAVCPQRFPETSLSYQITAEEIAGDDTNPANTFGMIFNYNETLLNGTRVESFYAFVILNEGPNSQYGFYHYDKSKPYPWIMLTGMMKAGNELHGGHGADAVNVVKVVEKTDGFTFFLNGQQIGTAHGDSLKPGAVGMMVGLKGTEVAFSHLLITRP